MLIDRIEELLKEYFAKEPGLKANEITIREIVRQREHSLSKEMEQLLASLREREDMRMLFKLAKDASPEDVRQAVKIIEALRRDD